MQVAAAAYGVAGQTAGSGGSAGSGAGQLSSQQAALAAQGAALAQQQGVMMQVICFVAILLCSTNTVLFPVGRLPGLGCPAVPSQRAAHNHCLVG